MVGGVVSEVVEWWLMNGLLVGEGIDEFHGNTVITLIGL